MLVQDAIPVGDSWLEEMIAPFEDERVVGVTVRQTPRPDSDPVGRWQVEYRARFLGEERRVQELDGWEKFEAMDFQERLRLASFDNVCSALRRQFWEKHPFRAISFAEDLDWGVRAIGAGGRLVYTPSACVVHSHNRPAAYHLRRAYISGRIVPGILHLPATAAGAENDDEFLELMGLLFGEARSILRDRNLDWAGFYKSCRLDSGLWRPFLTAIGLRPPLRTYWGSQLRENFYFILNQLLGADSPPIDQAGAATVLVKAVAEAAGSFAAV